MLHSKYITELLFSKEREHYAKLCQEKHYRKDFLQVSDYHGAEPNCFTLVYEFEAQCIFELM